MAQNYTRQSAIADGDTITASLFNNEYNQLVNTFAYSASSADSTGHRHDGTTAQGGNIFKIGDLDFLNKVEVDGTNNRIGFYVEVSSAAVEQIRVQDGAIVPVTDSDIDLGTSSLEFKDLFLDGTAHIDTLDVDANATVAGTLGVTGNTTVGGTLGVTGVLTGTSLDISGNVTVGGTIVGSSTIQGTTITATTAFVPDASDGASLGGVSLQFSDLFLADGALIAFGDDQDVTLTHLADAGLLLNGARGLFFNDTSQYINAPSATVLDIAATDEIELTATLVDVVGNLAVSGNVDVDGNIEFDGLSGTGSVTVTNILDEDNMSSDSATALATQQSIKAYVDAQQDTVDTFGEVLALSNTTSGTNVELTTTDKVQFRDAAIYINSSVDGQLDIVADTEIQIAATTIDIDGAINASGEIIAASLDISGDVDVDGTTNLDIVDIDGAVNMATTALVTGVLTTTATQVATGGITSGSNIVSDTDSTDDLGTTSVRWANLFVDGITATDQITATGFTGTLDGILGSGAAAAATVTTLDTSGAVNLNLVTDSSSSTSGALIVDGGVGIAKKLYVGTDLDVDGTTNLDVVDIDGAVDMASTLQVDGISTFTGQITANGGMEFVDNKKLTFGTGDDLEVYHDGNHSYINDVGTGNLFIRGANVVITTGAGTKYLEGGSNVLTLFHTGNERLRTSSTGVYVTGTVSATGTSVFESLDISGDIDVDGTTNLDVVDIDGAVDMASTLAVGGATTLASTLTMKDGNNSILLDGRTDGGNVAGTGAANVSVIDGVYATNSIAGARIAFAHQGGAGQRGGLTFASKNTDDNTNQPTVQGVLTPFGYWGFGTTNPQYKVEVAGTLGVTGATTLTAATAINANVANPLTINATLDSIAYSEIFNISTGASAAAYFGIVTQNLANSGTIRSGMFFDSSNHLNFINGEAGGAGIVLDDNNAVTMSGNLTVAGKYNITRGDITIATGAITPTTSYVRLDTQASATTDDLDTINGGVIGDIVVLETRISSRDVVVKDGTGNLGLAGGVDFTLVNKSSTITLIYDGTSWLEMSRSSN